MDGNLIPRPLSLSAEVGWLFSGSDLSVYSSQCNEVHVLGQAWDYSWGERERAPH